MAGLIVNPNMEGPDGFYERLIAAHRELSDKENADFNSRLILILANHSGDTSVLGDALDAAKPD